MSETTIDILMIDDDEDDFMLVRRLLNSIPTANYQIEWAPTYDAGLARMSGCGHDICLLDYNLGARNGLELLSEVRRRGCRIPVIMLTGLGAEDLDLAAMEAGALDYLSKRELTASHLSRSIRYGLQQSRTLKALWQSQETLERRVAERTADLAVSEERLREADRRKDDFLAMLAHELRNPLAPIRNAIHILKAYCTCAADEKTSRQRDIIERQVTHMAHLLDDLLDISRITRGKIQIKREQLDLRTVAEQAMESLHTMIEERKQHLYFQVPDSPLLVDGDPTRLDQVLRNLLNNAIKYTEAGGCIWMTLEVDSDAGPGWWALVRVRDSGIGIDPDLLGHIFEPFVQAEQSLARTQGGLGIGLSMVKRLIELHGGKVEARSQGLGRGAEFLIRLPLLQAEENKSGNGAMEQFAPDTITLKRILVVEDNKDAAESLGLMLELWGHHVRTVNDGRRALLIAKDWQPEVILLDIGLPEMDGYEVARHLRIDPSTARAYLVALTGYGAEEDRRRALEAGFNQHLTKPVEPKELQEVLMHTQHRRVEK